PLRAKRVEARMAPASDQPAVAAAHTSSNVAGGVSSSSRSPNPSASRSRAKARTRSRIVSLVATEIHRIAMLREPRLALLVQRQQVEPIAGQLVQQHFPEMAIHRVHVVGNLVSLARELAQPFPVASAQNIAQAGVVLRARFGGLHQADF